MVEKGSPKSKVLKGTIGKTLCEMTLDSGADRTVVREDQVSDHEYTGKISTVGVLWILATSTHSPCLDRD